MSAQCCEAVGESRLRGAQRDLQNGGHLVERQVVEVVQDEDGPARRGDAIDEARHVRRRRRLLGRGDFVQSLVGAHLIAPAPFAPERPERLARRDAVGPRSEQFRVGEPGQLAVDLDEDLLQDVVGQRGVAGEAPEVAVQSFLDALQQLVEGGAVSGLGAQHEEGGRAVHGTLGAQTPQSARGFESPAPGRSLRCG